MGKTNDESRRRFLKTAGAAAFTLGAAAAGCVDEDGGGGPGGPGDGYTPPRNPKLDYDDYKYTACGICMIQCGMKVYRKNSQAVFIEGNPADPFNRGNLCPKGKAAMGFLNNPDRLIKPLKRTSTEPKGFGVDPVWEEIEWSEAYDTIIQKMTEATETAPGDADFAKGEQFGIVSHGAYPWCKRFLEAIGSPNLVTHYDTCFSTSFVARKAITGGMVWTNLAGADYILSFGWDQPDRSKNHQTAQFADAVAAGAKVVCFNPYQGTVGAKANEWIPIQPGTDLAVMLAMINLMLTNGWYDTGASGIDRTNYSDNKAAIDANFAPYTAAWAESISGVPAATITRIAQEFGTATKALLPIHKRDGASGPNYANSFHAAHAAYVLNALVGAIDRDSGDACLAFGWKPSAPLTFEENPPVGFKDLIIAKKSIDGKHLFPLVRDLTTDRGIFTNFAERVLAGVGGEHGYALKMAIIRRYGLLSFPNPAKVADALKTLDYVVFVDTLPKQVMWFADLVLPEPTFLEGSGIAYRKYCTPGSKYVLAKNKIQQAPGECKGWTGILMELGKRLDLAKTPATQYFTLSGGGPVKSSDEKESMAEQVDPSGSPIPTLSDIQNAPDGIYHKDNTEDHPYAAKGTFGTASGKIEIYCTKMEDAATAPNPVYDPLPKWVAKAVTPDANYPFYLLLMRWPGLKHSAPLTSDNPYSLDAFPGPVAIIHPSKAGPLGIADGDTVWIESANGKMKAQARVSKRIRPDCVITNHNYGHSVEELTYRFADQGDGALIVDRSEADALSITVEGNPRGDWSAGARMSDVCVKVYRA